MDSDDEKKISRVEKEETDTERTDASLRTATVLVGLL